MGEVYSCLSEGTCHSPHSGPHYTTQDFMQGVEGTVLFFKLQYKQGESVLFPPASAVILNWHGMEKKKKATKIISGPVFKSEVYFSTP